MMGTTLREVSRTPRRTSCQDRSWSRTTGNPIASPLLVLTSVSVPHGTNPTWGSFAPAGRRLRWTLYIASSAAGRSPSARTLRGAAWPSPHVSSTAIAPPDQPVGRDRSEGGRQRRRTALARLEREEAVGRGGVGGPRVDFGEVDRHPAGFGRAEARHEARGPSARFVFRADLGLGPPCRA